MFYTLKRRANQLGQIHGGRLAVANVIISLGNGRRGGRDYRFIDLIFPTGPASRRSFCVCRPTSRTNEVTVVSMVVCTEVESMLLKGATGHGLTYRMSSFSGKSARAHLVF